ncbi:hypothetical protein [Nonomuraea jabiensis]|uniref:hypothetical protein n=1 Tax=Nonomuraea jabiensis TaxID=882448 RepID=UPI0036892E6F
MTVHPLVRRLMALTALRLFAMAAVHGHDAVIAAVGGSRIAYNLITAIRECGVARLVVTGSRSYPPPATPRLAVALACVPTMRAPAPAGRARSWPARRRGG